MKHFWPTLTLRIMARQKGRTAAGFLGNLLAVTLLLAALMLFFSVQHGMVEQELADKYQTETSANEKWLESEVRNYLKKVVLKSFISAYEMVLEDWKQTHTAAETHTEEKDTLEN